MYIETIMASKQTTKKTFTRWAVHKTGTEQLGYLCSFKTEAEDMLRDLKVNLLNMPESEKALYKVVEVKVEITEDV